MLIAGWVPRISGGTPPNRLTIGAVQGNQTTSTRVPAGWQERIGKLRSPCKVPRLLGLSIQGETEVGIHFNGQVGDDRQPAG